MPKGQLPALRILPMEHLLPWMSAAGRHDARNKHDLTDSEVFTMGDVYRLVGAHYSVTGRSVARWAQQGGLTPEEGDEIAVRLGLHPLNVWPEQWEAWAAAHTIVDDLLERDTRKAQRIVRQYLAEVA